MASQVIHINKSDENSLRDAYRTLPRKGEVKLSTDLNSMYSSLHSMEEAGFVGIEVENINPASGIINISGFKGKSGPCYNTGRRALYEGAGYAALDDDNHLLFSEREIKICEKTADIYLLPPYHSLIQCSNADANLLSKFDDVPEVFDCDTFEEDAEALFNVVKKSKPEEDCINLFYPGPFRMLIMNDGRIIKRGEVTRIARSYAESLKSKDGLFVLKNKEAAEPLFFQQQYSESGSRCLLAYHRVSELSGPAAEADFSVLRKLSPDLRKELINLVKNNNKYFILTGSDMGDKFGCCPSEIVTEANKLHKAGILDAYSQPVGEEACPVSIFAFRDEIEIKGNDLKFNVNEDFRNSIIQLVDDKRKAGFKLAARWILSLFILVTIVTAIVKLNNSSESHGLAGLYAQVSPDNDNQLVVLLFHNSERCSQCLLMEKYINELLDDDFYNLVEDHKLKFKLITMDTNDNLNLVERFGLYTSSVVLIEFENRNEKKITVLKDSWEYLDNEKLFKDMLREELHKFLNQDE